MDEQYNIEPPFDTDEFADGLDGLEGQIAEESPIVEETSSEYLRNWNHLISTTNWEKGRIIQHWREALIAVDAMPASYADEAWSRRVGNITPQHVGRLRRVFDRFYDDYKKYNGLFWSHFQAALDWEDAEMWLEGAVQNGWSVVKMRSRRWEAIGAPADQRPRDEDIIVAELDEDAPRTDEMYDTIDGTPSMVKPTKDEKHETPDDLPPEDDFDSAVKTPPSNIVDDDTHAQPVRPFEDVPELPPDLTAAVESMKLAIIRHRMNNWRDVYCDDVLAALNALRQLALAPPEKA